MVSDIKNYMAVTAAYWGFTLTDGALRMLVLLHFHHLGYKPLDLAFLFLLYEAMGIVTNLVGGWIGARFGLRYTLFGGLALQVGALSALSFLNPDWSVALSLTYVMVCQALSGIAKDLTKMSSKSAVKLVVSDQSQNGQQSGLFKWVALLTGSKNALKGIGFFLGGGLLETFGFVQGLWIMAGALGLVLIFALLQIKSDLGKAKAKIKGKDLFSKSREINILSFARIFLFAARDVWFVVGVPVFLSSQFNWNFDQVGLFMALWVIGYGIIQALVPKISRQTKNSQDAGRATLLWGLILALLPPAIIMGMDQFAPYQAYILVGGLLIFGAVFALNSSLHSYLIVAFSDHDKVALNVGFYYMANAAGRLIGTLLSGLLYQYWGLGACLWMAGGMALVAALSLLALKRPAAQMS